MPSYLRGEVFHDKLFFYSNNPIPCDKLLLVLNKNHKGNEDVVIVPATTNKRDYPYMQGCNKNDKVYYVKQQTEFYRDKSIIQYEFVESVPIEEFERRKTSKQMSLLKNKVIGRELQAILDCLKSIKEDIPPEIFDLIF
jgi:hypothetical protein